MTATARFLAYAASFEKAVEDDDWSVLEPFFETDAVYEVSLPPPLGGRFEGREAIFAYFKDALDRFDRRFESRAVELLEGPREQDAAVWVRGRARYRAAGVPELVFDLEETAHFAGDRIRRLEDRYAPATAKAMQAYLETHGAKLGIG